MKTVATTQKLEVRSKKRSVILLSLALGAIISAMVALAGTARQAEAASSEKVVFATNRTTGTGVNNPTGDYEIFRMNPDGTGVRQLTTNKVDDVGPIISPDGTKVAYTSFGKQTSNLEGDHEVYRMSTLDGRGKQNLTNNGDGVNDIVPFFSSDGQKVFYETYGEQTTNPEGDREIYNMNTVDEMGPKNLTNNGDGVSDFIYPD